MIPWIESHTYAIGPLVLQTWGTFVAAGFLLGGWLAAKRATARGLDPRIVWDMVFWIFVASLIGSRLFHVLLYDPAYYLAHPLDAFDPRRPGFAIMGGFLGALFAFTIIVRSRLLDFFSYADTLIWGLPWGCGVGRIGCFLIHDHPGTMTSFIGGVRYPDGNVRHDLGLYLSLFGFATGIALVLLDRKRRGVGFFFGSFLVIEGVGRFLLDFLRVGDRLIIGLTPTQWLLIPMAVIGGFLIRKSFIVK